MPQPIDPSRSLLGRWRLIVLLALALLFWADPAATADAPTAHAQVAAWEAPIVGGERLEVAEAAGQPLYYDRAVAPTTVRNMVTAVELEVQDIPRITGLPPIATSFSVYILADRDRFRLAIAELQGAQLDQVSDRANGIAIQRDGRLIMLVNGAVSRSPAAVMNLVSHELTHLVVAQAAAFRPITQWLNEGYAEAVRKAVLRERFPDAAEALDGLHRAPLASALLRGGSPLPWPELVTFPGFNRRSAAGYGQVAYGQSTLMTEMLLARHGQASVPDFFRAIGQGQSATAAFGASFGSFGPQADAFQASVAGLPAEFPPGLDRLTSRPRTDGVGVLAIVGGNPGEPVVVETYAAGEVVDRQEVQLDAVGFRRIELPDAVRPGEVLVRATVPSLGILEAALTVEPAVEFGPGPMPAPVQIPRAGEDTSSPADWSARCPLCAMTAFEP
jgi:hypothetical protein